MDSRKLSKIVNIISGYSFRTSVRESNNTSLYTLQSKNISDDVFIQDNELTEIDDMGYKSTAFVINNDVILSSRGSFKTAVIKTNKKILASSSVYILRIKVKVILPEYLAIFLRSRKGLSYLEQASTGATIKNLSLKNLGGIEITIPDLETQKKLIDLHTCNALFNKLLIKKSNIVRDMALEIINTL